MSPNFKHHKVIASKFKPLNQNMPHKIKQNPLRFYPVAENKN
jgi:hypothetical protein